MENRFYLKVAGIASLVFFSVLVMIFVAMDWDAAGVDPESDKQVEIHGSVIAGYDKGRLSWRVGSDYVWTGSNQFLFTVEGINFGHLFDSQGRLVLGDLTAQRMRVNSKNKTMMATGGITAVIYDRNATGNVEAITVEADSLKYFDVSGAAYLKDNVVIRQKDIVIKPRKEVVYDTESGIAEMSNGVSFASEFITLEAKKMEINIDERFSVFKGGVSGKRLADKTPSNAELDDREILLRKKDSRFTADYMEYSHHTGEDDLLAVLRGNVKIFQDDKHMAADEVSYDASTRKFSLTGNVLFVTRQLNWLLSDDRKTNFSNSEMKDAADASVTVNTQSLVFDGVNQVITAGGKTRIEQVDKVVLCRGFRYEDETGILTFKGPVEVEKEGEDSMKTEEMSIDIYREDVRASGRVEAEFVIED